MQVGVYTDVLWVQEVEIVACNNCNWVNIYMFLYGWSSSVYQ